HLKVQRTARNTWKTEVNKKRPTRIHTEQQFFQNSVRQVHKHRLTFTAAVTFVQSNNATGARIYFANSSGYFFNDGLVPLSLLPYNSPIGTIRARILCQANETVGVPTFESFKRPQHHQVEHRLHLLVNYFSCQSADQAWDSDCVLNSIKGNYAARNLWQPASNPNLSTTELTMKLKK
ncbi:hypothetical protein M514_02020, partial [Trichuris suis]